TTPLDRHNSFFCFDFRTVRVSKGHSTQFRHFQLGSPSPRPRTQPSPARSAVISCVHPEGQALGARIARNEKGPRQTSAAAPVVHSFACRFFGGRWRAARWAARRAFSLVM